MALSRLPSTMTPDPLVTPAQVQTFYRFHHRASVRGYLGKKSTGEVFQYDGRYGTGFAILTHRTDSKGHCWCDYYIGRKDEKNE